MAESDKKDERSKDEVPAEVMPQFPPAVRPMPDAPQGNSDNPYKNDVERVLGKPVEEQEQPAVNPEVPGSPDTADDKLAPEDAEDKDVTLKNDAKGVGKKGVKKGK